MSEALFDLMTSGGHEQILFCREPSIGLRAIIAIHDTSLGPALGGCRIRDYASEEDALRDVMRLSRAMTYKAAVAGLDLGGGKSVIIGPPSIRSEALLRTFGRHVHSLGGRYLVAEDMNTTVREMAWIARETPYVTGLPPAWGGLGEPGPVTAYGVYQGIRAALQVSTGSADVRGRFVAIQGLGSVGWHLTKRLSEAGARVGVSDLDASRVQGAIDAFGAEGIDVGDFLTTPCDVLSPCAVGGVLDATSIPLLRTQLVVGAANNILDDEQSDAERCRDHGVLFVPDYVVNAGGLIAMYAEWTHGAIERAMADTERIYETTRQVLSHAAEKRCTTTAASAALAEERIAKVSRTRTIYAPPSRPPEGPPYTR